MGEHCFMSNNYKVLEKLSHSNKKEKHMVFQKSGETLILAICEIFFNLIHFSNKENLNDKQTIRSIKKNEMDIGVLISPNTSIKRKRQIILENINLQKILFKTGLKGYEYFLRYHNHE